MNTKEETSSKELKLWVAFIVISYIILFAIAASAQTKIDLRTQSKVLGGTNYGLIGYSTATVDTLRPAGANLMLSSNAGNNGWNWVPGVTGPAGSDKEVQFNDGGVFGASSEFSWNKTDIVLSLGVPDDMYIHGQIG